MPEAAGSPDLTNGVIPPSTAGAAVRTRPGWTRGGGILKTLVLTLALAWLIVHLAWLPRGLEDIDSVNFALGLRDFDPVLHQPHPPGYPVYVGLGKVSRFVIGAVAPGMSAEAVDALALAWWSAAGGALALAAAGWLLVLLGRAASTPMPGSTAVLSVLLLGVAPLFWISGLRPLSDMPGLAFALLVAIAAVRAQERDGRAALPHVAVAGALAGAALGIRSQLLPLVVPLLVFCVLARRPRARRLLVATAAFGLGALTWAIPLVFASGGPERYLVALGTIANADFTEVRMLWTHPSPRTLAVGLFNTFVIPWGHQTLGVAVLLVTAAGAIGMAWSRPRLFGWIALAFGPYVAFHLLFQDTEYTRYALPLLVPVVWCAVWGMCAAGTRVATAGVLVFVAGALVLAVPVTRAYARSPMPTSEVVAEALARWARQGGVVGGHFDFARSVSVTDLPKRALLAMPRFEERAEVARYFTDGGEGPVWFVASPLRTDLQLIDPAAREVVRASAWPFSRRWFSGGTRPSHAELVRVTPPGWIAAEGWHLTREEINFSVQKGNPTPRMYVRSRPGGAVLFLGGEHSAEGLASGTQLELLLTLDGRELARLSAPAGTGRFFHRLDLPDGALRVAQPYGVLEVHVQSGAVKPPVQFTHFDLQPPDRAFWVYSHGWHDHEWDRVLERSFRWAGPRASLRVHPAGRDQVLRITGEAPVEALGGAPTLTLTAGGLMLHRWRADGPFTESVRVSHADLARAEGLLELASDRLFVPGGAGGDQRELAVRVDALTIYPVGP